MSIHNLLKYRDNCSIDDVDDNASEGKSFKYKAKNG